MAVEKNTAKEADKKEVTKYEFLVDYPVGTKKDGSPKKVYKKGQKYPLSDEVARDLKKKFIIK